MNLIAFDIEDFANNDVDGFVDEFFAFNKFKCCYVAFDVANPTDISPIFGLQCDASGYLFTESDLDPSLAVDSFGIDIFIPIYNGATRDTQIGSVGASNCIVHCKSAISPSNYQCERTRGKWPRNNRGFACDSDSTSTYHDISGYDVEGNRDTGICGNFTARWGYTVDVKYAIFKFVIVIAASSEH